MIQSFLDPVCLMSVCCPHWTPIAKEVSIAEVLILKHYFALLFLGNRRPANLATAFFDGSSLYGSDPVTETRLRGHVNGELRSALIQGQQLPIPAAFDPSRCRSGQQTPCFDLGKIFADFEIF